MTRGLQSRDALFACLVIMGSELALGAAAEVLKVSSEKTVNDIPFPESVAYNPNAKALYVSEFVSELKPTQKDGAGRISKLSLDGTVQEERFLPAEGQTLNKPKGIWVEGDRLWVTDIDSVWVFDTGSKKGRKVALPEAQFANDEAVLGGALYVSDNEGDQLYRVEPADFLNMQGAPKVTRIFSGAGVYPNGLYPAGDSILLMAGFQSAEQPRGVYELNPGAPPQAVSKPIGRLDGLYRMGDGELLVTDWDSGSLGTLDPARGFQKLASGFKGPADFGVVENADGLLVVVPDLVKSELRFVQLGK